ncbi:MAG TPA: enoyl-CoA hydratase-related protein [Candidatus Limnocylindrales bacterium]|nr:enoyl-CoA hydratase-related protein [Candidatus Limnocylindrales bacterium]
MTQTVPTDSAQPAEQSLVRLEFPAPVRSGPAAGVALVTIDRPDVLNALSFDLLDDLATVLERLDVDPDCRAIVLTGSGTRAFAAGADIRELARQTPVSLLVENRFGAWDRIGAIRTPLIAAVRGFALGGGCELAMSCDLIVAGEDAVFGQPEINLGVMPGAGGTQRLTRAIGKARAMDLILTGRTITAADAERMGLVSRVVASDATLDEALDLAMRIAGQAPVAVLAAKEAVRAAQELPLAAGLQHERRAFYLLFASDDQDEGMAAFVEKRSPTWKGR